MFLCLLIHWLIIDFLILISALNLIERINKKRNMKAVLIRRSGNNIEISIEGDDNLLMLAG